MKLLNRTLLFVSVILFTCLLILYGTYITLPTHNTGATHFDTLIVLGYPAKPDGTPSPEERERVLEAVRQYKAGVAPHIIMTGAAAHNQFVEAHIMDAFAQSQGIPAAAITEEPQAHDTIQNLYYSAKIMHQQGWGSAEIISTPSHLPRAALVANTLNIDQPTLSINWSTHPAHWPPEYTLWRRLRLYTAEAHECLYLRFHGFPNSKFLPNPFAD